MPTPIWTLPLDSAPRGLSLAREANRLLVWTDTNWLLWANRKGQRQAQVHFDSPINAAAVSDDGAAFVTATADGRVNWLALDLTSRWERRVNGKPTAVAVAPLGQIAAVATNQGQVYLFGAAGETIRTVACPRSAHHLSFVPDAATLIGASDLGWVGALDAVTGKWPWRDTPVSDIGSMAVAGEGGPLLLACFSDGLRGYRPDGQSWTFAKPFPSCRAVSLSYDGQVVVVLQLDGLITAWSLDQQPLFTYRPRAAVTALAISALGDTLHLAQNDKSIVAVAIED